MTKIIQIDEIKKALADIDLVPLIEKGFVEYSKGNVIVPPVGELLFHDPPGDVHIKYGAIKNDDYYVVKIASGFGKNQELYGLSSLQGLMLLFNQKTGQPVSILLDQGYLTNIRTAVAGTISAKYLAPKNVKQIGIVGTGIQAKMQLKYLKPVTECKDVLVWGRSKEKLENYKTEMSSLGYNISTTTKMRDVTSSSNLIVTTTSANESLITADQIEKGTHITAMGSDTIEKRELDPKILQLADLVVVDSISQSKQRGEIFHALNAGFIKEDQLIELGTMIEKKEYQRISDDQITIADLTGVAIQDIQITKAVYQGIIDTE